MKIEDKFLHVAFLLLVGTSLYAQQKNTLLHTDSSLISFKEKVSTLSKGKNGKVRIFHFGDSHIQPNNLTGETRRKFQDEYGNGGRGLIFPYSLASTNGPKDFWITSSVKWTNSWNIKYPHLFPIGIAGIGIKSIADSGSVILTLKKDSLYNPYTRAFVIYSMENPGDGKITLNNSVTKTGCKGAFDTLSIIVDKPLDSLTIKFSGTKLTIHGICVENESPGIIYHSTGVAGARYSDYNRTSLFLEQLPLLRPDLVIISLGTNESFSKTFDPKKFETDVDSLLTRIQKRLPNVEILITLPSENYRVKSNIPVANATVSVVSDILVKQAKLHNCAIWDLYQAMGGKGSMLTWRKEGLVNKDHIHFLRAGYKKQGGLLFEAIESYVKTPN